MAKHKYPEQRSATAEPRPGQMPAKPTGNEVFNPNVSSQGASAYTTERLPPPEPMISTQREPVRRTEGRGAVGEWIRENRMLALIGGIALGLLVGSLRR